MSVTTSVNPQPATLSHVLADYNIHHSQQPEAAVPTPATNVTPVSPPSNPPGWEDRWRRVPPHRPIRNQMDESRNSYNNAIEHGFIWVMFGGVHMEASGSRLWRATGGKIRKDVFKFKVGGEW